MLNFIKKEQFYSYDIYLFDLWGVVHDGSTLYEGIANVFNNLSELNKVVCFISNAPRRSYIVRDLLIKFKIKNAQTAIIMTSGECFYENILQKIKNDQDSVFYIGPQKDLCIFDDLKLRVETKDPQNCKFGIISGFGDGVENDINLATKLKQCKAKNLEMFCINPDLYVVRQDGSSFECAGLIANLYKNIGGNVKYFGKPYSEIYINLLNLVLNQPKDIEYEEKLRGVNELISQKKILAVGDSISTDITGANNIKIDSLLTTYGIHKKQIQEVGLESFISSFSMRPSFIIESMKNVL
jgi:HAD superfamily hydrolase (TIGR01459 family)